MKYSIILIVVMLLLVSCREEISNPGTGNYKVSGKILYKSKSVANATVSLNNSINYTTQTDTGGNFQIGNVPKDSYNFKVQKIFNDGSYLTTNSTVAVSSDVYLEALRLPVGAILYEVKNSLSSETAISWSPTDANDFREYKLFRHTSSGIDENTGTLIHVSTSITDTSFYDSGLNPLTDYYYRVYVMNDYGILGGSNIIKATTKNKNLILNGDFEEVGNDSLPTGWIFRSNKGAVKILQGIEAYSGINCLIINPTNYIYDLSWGSLRYGVPYTELVGGSQYTLSFWYYIEALEGNSQLEVEFKPEQSLFIYDFITGTNTESGVWKKYERTFTAPLNPSVDFYLEFEINVNIPYNHELWKMRIDNVSLLKSN